MADKKQYYVKVLDGAYRVITLKEGVDPEQYIAEYATGGITVLTCKGQPPSMKKLAKYSFDGISKATDGCQVEPDGVCEHGHPAWTLALNVI